MLTKTGRISPVLSTMTLPSSVFLHIFLGSSRRFSKIFRGKRPLRIYPIPEHGWFASGQFSLK
jgi:hypothetical protein